MLPICQRGTAIGDGAMGTVCALMLANQGVRADRQIEPRLHEILVQLAADAARRVPLIVLVDEQRFLVEPRTARIAAAVFEVFLDRGDRRRADRRGTLLFAKGKLRFGNDFRLAQRGDRVLSDAQVIGAIRIKSLVREDHNVAFSLDGNDTSWRIETRKFSKFVRKIGQPAESRQAGRILNSLIEFMT